MRNIAFRVCSPHAAWAGPETRNGGLDLCQANLHHRDAPEISRRPRRVCRDGGAAVCTIWVGFATRAEFLLRRLILSLNFFRLRWKAQTRGSGAETNYTA